MRVTPRKGMNTTLALLLAALLCGCSGLPSTVAPLTTKTAIFSSGKPLAQFATGSFAGSGNCAVCHSQLKDGTGKDVSIDSQWRSSLMANAAKDPFWQANVSTEISENPQLKSAIEDACALCHMPAARTQALADKNPVAVLENGFLSGSHSLNAAAMDGNTCTLCHQIQLADAKDVTKGFSIDTSVKAPSRPLYGPYNDPLTGPMQTVVGYTPAYGAQVSDSRLCATCHTVYTPFVDNEGKVGGTFPEQTAYLEWQQSMYAGGVACQACHMPAASNAAIAGSPGNLAARSPFFQHQFVGGNTVMLKVLQNYLDEMGITASTSQLEDTIARVDSQMSRAASLTVVNAAHEGDNLSVTFQLTDLAGHKFPTGFPSRRAWIHLTVTDSSGKVVFESGKVNADGSITGNDADTKSGSPEPHYDVITAPDQVLIYESIMADVNGKPTYVLLRGSTYLKDNRVLPNGFDKAKSMTDTAVAGAALTDANFKGGGDQITYKIPAKSGSYTVKAELLYQEMGFAFARSLFAHSGTLVSTFNNYYRTTDSTPGVVATVSKDIG